jgi:hypothetical protein
LLLLFYALFWFMEADEILSLAAAGCVRVDIGDRNNTAGCDLYSRCAGPTVLKLL